MLGFGLPGQPEIILLLVLLFLLFGAKRLPDLARSIGKSITEFKKGARELTDEIDAEPKNENGKGKGNGNGKPKQLENDRDDNSAPKDG